MAKLPSLITNNLTGEALNYYGNPHNNNPIFKQTFKVTQNADFTWTVKSELYIKLDSSQSSSGQNVGTCYIQIADKAFDIQDVQIMVTGVWVRGSQISSNPYEWTKILDCMETFESPTGRRGVKLTCGTNNNGNKYYFTDYTLIYLTLPSFSGMQYKVNNKYNFVMPWIKINGEWKRAIQYIKINGEWTKYNDTWLWNPEG